MFSFFAIRNLFLALDLPDQCAARNFNQEIFASVPIHALPQSALSVLCNQPWLVVLGDQIVQIVVRFQYDIAPATTVSPAGPAFRPVFLPLKRYAAFPSVTRPCVNFDFVDEHVNWSPMALLALIP